MIEKLKTIEKLNTDQPDKYEAKLDAVNNRFELWIY